VSSASADRLRRRTHHHTDFPLERLVTGREHTVSVVLPARNEAATIGGIVDVMTQLRDGGLVDQVLVVDDSTDDTARIAAERGAEVHRQADLRPEVGPLAGKGDAMWRALEVATGDVVAYFDADSLDLGEHFVRGVLGPLLCDPEVRFVKATYRRPLRVGDAELAAGGGRVTELMARPLLSRFFPELAWFGQPLAGELAARRELLERIPFACGYRVEVAMLIDVLRVAGLDAMAQVDLDVRRNQHQPLEALGPMANAVLDAVLARAAETPVPAPRERVVTREGVLVAEPPEALERPPFAAAAEPPCERPVTTRASVSIAGR
jgi:glucosyl-3-phosphoglycerate synthase